MAALAPLTIAYITETSPEDKHAWSGTAHYACRALTEAGFTVRTLGPAFPRYLRMLLGTLNKISLRLTGRRFDYRHSSIYARAFAKLFGKKLRGIRADCIVVCGGTEYGAYLHTGLPVFYILDRTIAGAINYHLILQDLWPFSCAQSIATDKRAMEGARHLFFSSKWAADHARVHYGIPQHKITVVAFGANIDLVPTREEALAPKPPEPFRLLFIGSSWEHKGGAIAYAALLDLLSAGHKASLTIVGCTPPERIDKQHATVIPFVDKNTPDGMRQFHQLLKQHHLLILPTRFDCTPIVFCEASAFGLPILSAETGGVEGHVKEGINGFLVSYQDKGPGYAKKITELIERPAQYEALRRTSRALYESTLNWKSWAATVAPVIRQASNSR